LARFLQKVSEQSPAADMKMAKEGGSMELSDQALLEQFVADGSVAVLRETRAAPELPVHPASKQGFRKRAAARTAAVWQRVGSQNPEGDLQTTRMNTFFQRTLQSYLSIDPEAWFAAGRAGDGAVIGQWSLDVQRCGKVVSTTQQGAG